MTKKDFNSFKKIKLTYLIRRAAGGMQTHLLDLISKLDKDRYKITVVAPQSQRLEEGLANLSIPLIALDIDDNLRPLKDLRTIISLRNLFKTLKPDILHIHGNKAALVGRIAAWGMSIQAIIVTIHNLLKYQSQSKVKRFFSTFADRFLARYTDVIISVSKDLEEDLVQKEGLPRKKIITIYNGIDWHRLQVEPQQKKTTRESLGFNDKDIVIGMIARLAPQKSPLTFVEAARELASFSSLKFLLVGDGPLMPIVQEKIKEAGLSERFVLPGFRKDIPEILAAIDLFVLSSKWEGFPYVLHEAMAAGKPLVATSVGGVPELVVDGVSGVLVPAGDSSALAQAISSVAFDPKFQEILVKNAHSLLQEKFSLEKMAKQTEKVYLTCLRHPIKIRMSDYTD